MRVIVVSLISLSKSLCHEDAGLKRDPDMRAKDFWRRPDENPATDR